MLQFISTLGQCVRQNRLVVKIRQNRLVITVKLDLGHFKSVSLLYFDLRLFLVVFLCAIIAGKM